MKKSKSKERWNRPDLFPTEHHKIPMWVKKEMTLLKKQGQLSGQYFRIYDGYELNKLLPSTLPRIMDHWGREGNELITEPYGTRQDHQPAVTLLTNMLRCQHRWGIPTWTTGNGIVRIEFFR